MTDSHTRSKSRPGGQTVAIALKHDPTGERAPTVVAGGRGKVADQILEIAFANGIKVREDADLAQLLNAVDMGSEIPLEAFAAVAQILAYVYRANGEAPPLEGTAPPDAPPPLFSQEIP